MSVEAMFKTAVGHSNDPDSLEAIVEVIAQCQQTLGADVPRAGLLFTSVEFDHQLILNHIHQVFPDIELIGGTADGEVSSVLEFQQDSLTLILFCSDTVEFKAAVGLQVSTAPQQVSAQAVLEAQAQLQTPPKLCLTIPESLTTNASEILMGLASALNDVPICGGMAADDLHMRSTRQFYKTEVLKDAVPVLLLGGALDFSTGYASGWKPMGQAATVTKVQGNVIYEIDHKPALEFYRYYFDEFKPDYSYPLAVSPPGEPGFFLRAVLSHDAEQGSIYAAGHVPLHAKVQITDASMNDVIAAAQTSFKKALEQYPGSNPAAALLFSCTWRRLVMGSRSNEEYQRITESLKQPIPTCGFYTFGEISPLQDQGKSFLHNTTFVTLLLGGS
jgi:hypothetical protein